jgi:hypothetical protein
VLLEVVPFRFGGFSILRGGTQCAAVVEVGAVGANEVVVEYRDVGLGGVEVLVPEHPGRDVDRQSVGHCVGGPQPAEVVRGVAQRLVSGVGEAGALGCR